MTACDVYIINMKDDLEKHRHMDAQCSEIFGSYQFSEAVVGRALSDGEVERVYNEEAAIRAIGRPLSVGEIGCFLSHRRIYESLLVSEAHGALVLEDDVIISPEVGGVIPDVFNVEGWDVVFLGHHGKSSRDARTLISFWGRKRLSGKVVLGRPCERPMGTYGYIVSRSGAEKLMRLTSRVERPIDHLTGDVKELNLYCVIDPLVTIDPTTSDLFHAMHEREELKQKKKAHHSQLVARSIRARAISKIERIKRDFEKKVRMVWPRW